MNPDELGNLGKQTATFLLSFVSGITASADQKTAIAAGIGALVSVCWSIYSHWNMKKVPETTP
jgi:hypothetical protein